MKQTKYIGGLLGVILLISCSWYQTTQYDIRPESYLKVAENSKPVNHEQWGVLLNKYVNDEGDVNYKGFLDDKKALSDYLAMVSDNPPNDDWTKNEKLAYWINAYNAFTVKLIIDHYPLKSIQDLHPTLKIPGIRTVWHKEFFKIGGEKESLNDIEHKILRKKFDEPRIHFAINCASFSCPRLLNEAYMADKLENQLAKQASYFINDPDKNKITSDSIELSKIFSWFRGDFTKEGTLIEFLNKYSTVKIEREATIKYLPYNWSLNEQK